VRGPQLSQYLPVHSTRKYSWRNDVSSLKIRNNCKRTNEIDDNSFRHSLAPVYECQPGNARLMSPNLWSPVYMCRIKSAVLSCQIKGAQLSQPLQVVRLNAVSEVKPLNLSFLFRYTQHITQVVWYWFELVSSDPYKLFSWRKVRLTEYFRTVPDS